MPERTGTAPVAFRVIRWFGLDTLTQKRHSFSRNDTWLTHIFRNLRVLGCFGWISPRHVIVLVSDSVIWVTQGA